MTQQPPTVIDELLGLSDLTNLFGHLSADYQNRIRRVFENPTDKTWDNAYSIIIRGKDMLTLWRAWIATDPDALRVGPVTRGVRGRRGKWSRVPTSEQIFNAIRFAACDGR